MLASGLVAVAFLIAGCTGAADCAGQQGPGSQSGVCNATDAFSYGGQMSGQDGTETYTWENTAERAQVNWGGQGSMGSVTVTMEDAAGTQVYRSTFSGGQSGTSETTRAGEPGDWTIRISFDGFTGQMGLSVTAR